MPLFVRSGSEAKEANGTNGLDRDTESVNDRAKRWRDLDLDAPPQPQRASREIADAASAKANGNGHLDSGMTHERQPAATSSGLGMMPGAPKPSAYATLKVGSLAIKGLPDDILRAESWVCPHLMCKTVRKSRKTEPITGQAMSSPDPMWHALGWKFELHAEDIWSGRALLIELWSDTPQAAATPTAVASVAFSELLETLHLDRELYFSLVEANSMDALAGATVQLRYFVTSNAALHDMIAGHWPARHDNTRAAAADRSIKLGLENLWWLMKDANMAGALQLCIPDSLLGELLQQAVSGNSLHQQETLEFIMELLRTQDPHLRRHVFKALTTVQRLWSLRALAKGNDGNIAFKSCTLLRYLAENGSAAALHVLGSIDLFRHILALHDLQSGKVWYEVDAAFIGPLVDLVLFFVDAPPHMVNEMPAEFDVKLKELLPMTAFVRVVLSWLPRSKSAEALHMLHRLDTSSWGQPEVHALEEASRSIDAGTDLGKMLQQLDMKVNGVDIVNGEVAYDASMFEADRSRLESQAETPVVDEDIMAAFSIVRAEREKNGVPKEFGGRRSSMKLNGCVEVNLQGMAGLRRMCGALNCAQRTDAGFKIDAETSSSQGDKVKGKVKDTANKLRSILRRDGHA